MNYRQVIQLTLWTFCRILWNSLFQLLTQFLTEMNNPKPLQISADFDFSLVTYINILMWRIIYIRMFVHSCMEDSSSVLDHLYFYSVYAKFADTLLIIPHRRLNFQSLEFMSFGQSVSQCSVLSIFMKVCFICGYM